MHKQLLAVGTSVLQRLIQRSKFLFFKRTVKIHWIRSGTARAKMSLTKMFLEFSRTRLGDTLNANLARSKKMQILQDRMWLL